jgi:hypothetical protein
VSLDLAHATPGGLHPLAAAPRPVWRDQGNIAVTVACGNLAPTL